MTASGGQYQQGANVGRGVMDLVQEANEKFRLPASARGAIGPRARVAAEVDKLEDYIIAQQKR